MSFISRSQPFYTSVGAGLVKANFAFYLISAETDSPGDVTYLDVEDLAYFIGNGWYRIVNLPDSDGSKDLLVALVGAPETIIYQERITGVLENTRALEALFAVAGGNSPITFSVTDLITILPLPGVQISVWDISETTCYIPVLTTNNAGIAKAALPPGIYSIFFFRTFTKFEMLPQIITVNTGGDPIIFSYFGTAVPASVAAFNRSTIFGKVLNADGTPMVGVEIKLKVADQNQTRGDASFARKETSAFTDNTGYFELTPIAGMKVTISCPSTGYSRSAFAPLTGAQSWIDFGAASI